MKGHAAVTWLACEQMQQHRLALGIDELLEVGNVYEWDFSRLMIKTAVVLFHMCMSESDDDRLKMKKMLSSCFDFSKSLFRLYDFSSSQCKPNLMQLLGSQVSQHV